MLVAFGNFENRMEVHRRTFFQPLLISLGNGVGAGGARVDFAANKAGSSSAPL